MHNKYILRKLCHLINECCFGRRDERARIISKEKDFCKIEDHFLFSNFHKNANFARGKRLIKFGIGCILVRNSHVVFRTYIRCSRLCEDEMEFEGPLLSVEYTTGLLCGTTWAMNWTFPCSRKSFSLCVHPLSHTGNIWHVSYSLQFMCYKIRLIICGHPPHLI